MVQVRCILYGLGQGGYIELWMNLAKHTFHTRSASSFRTFFRLNLSLVNLASGVPWAGKGLPFPFSLDGFLCRCSVNNKSTVRLLGIGSAFWIRLRFKETVRLHLFAPFQMDVTTAAFLVVVVVFGYDLPLSCTNLNWSITLHLTVYALLNWSFHSQGSTR